MARNAVRMKDIAQKLNISVVTVSKALGGKEGVGDALRQKIREAAAQMGYQSKELQKGKEPGGSVGILMAEHLIKPEHSFYWALYLNLVESFKEHRYHNMFELVDTKAEQALLPAFISEGKAEGVVVLGSMPESYLKMLEETGLPLVQVDSSSNVRSVSIIADGYRGTAEMTQYMINKGHRDIGFVGSVKANIHMRDCYYGYLKTLDLNGIPFREEWVLPDRDGYDFKQNFELPEQMPTAFVCSSDQGAYHFVQDLQRKGFKIPDDLSVTGFYGHVFSTLVTPQITTYSIDLKAMAQKAVEAQISLLENASQKRGMRVICGEILERESVRALTDLQEKP